MSEKRKALHDLGSFRAWALSPAFRLTGSALRGAFALGFSAKDVVAFVQTMRRDHFVKSMTSYDDHRSWQDVYHVPSEAGLVYVKFREDVVTNFLLLSFKEKDDGH